MNFSAFDSLIDQLFYSFPTESKPPMSKTYKLDDNDKIVGIQLQLALAGMSNEGEKKEVKVWGDNGKLYIEGDNDLNDDISAKFRNKFSWALPVSNKLDISRSSAELKNGLLTIDIPLVEVEESRHYLLGSE
jgi:HSP20 family molecular chaperone IbpA